MKTNERQETFCRQKLKTDEEKVLHNDKHFMLYTDVSKQKGNIQMKNKIILVQALFFYI